MEDTIYTHQVGKAGHLVMETNVAAVLLLHE